MKTLAALLFAASTTVAAVPDRIAAEYRLTNGRVTESYVRKGDSYEILSVSRSEGILKVLYDEQITLQSSGRVGEAGLRPLQFEERRARDPKRDVSATFDWERG